MRILVTAGAVYGKLDDNKVVGNRARGIWATRFADHFAGLGHEVILLLPDIQADDFGLVTGVTRVYHSGFFDYAAKCEAYASQVDAAILAAAVVNWIPAEPVAGKMPTAGYREGSIINIPFMLAPRVINRMRQINPKLTLIGCKMLSGATDEELIAASRQVLEASKAHVVLANDFQSLKRKLLVYPDGTVQDFGTEQDFQRRFAGLFDELQKVIEDQHYTTVQAAFDAAEVQRGRDLITAIANKYRSRFTPNGDGKVFGAIAVPVWKGWLVTPRTKKADFTGKDAVLVYGVDHENHAVLTAGGKASMNAPLLIRMGEQRAPGCPILHLHEQLPNGAVQDYAPPGTVRDSMRSLDGPYLNIKGHGFVAPLDPVTLEIAG